MEILHKIMFKIPIFTVWYWLFCAIFLIETDFYTKYFELLDNIDTAVVFISTSHYVFFNKKYSVCCKLYFQCIYAIVILNFMYAYLNEKTYYLLFYTISLTFIILSLWRTRK